jgi:hypothetical protein
VFLDRALYFDNAVLNIDKWLPCQFLRSSREVRQGDPLSPFLFVIVMEALSRMITTAIDNGRLSGFSVGSRLSKLVNTSHLLFAEDSLVWGEF